MNSSKRILIAPLNWGLGHATRCIPIIRALEEKGAEVLIASDGRALALLKKEFPTLNFFDLPAYNIQYPFSNMILSIGWQLPKIVMAIWKEKRVIEQLIDKEKIDIIISDNRFGCFSKKVKTIFLTHQLNIKMPYSWLELPVYWGNYFWIKKFDECWIPDFKGENSLSGDLSISPQLRARPVKSLRLDRSKSSLPFQFIGPLSRMTPQPLHKKYTAIFILSGPEPQRTILEKKILDQLPDLSGNFLIIQGKTERRSVINLKEHIKIISFMTSEELNQSILESEIVISRSGYSTIMDLANLGQKAILIPTPGQTEQEYLAKRFFDKGIFYYQKQEELDLKIALEKGKLFTGFRFPKMEDNRLRKVISELLAS